jgi:hypothetical protein
MTCFMFDDVSVSVCCGCFGSYNGEIFSGLDFN